jgi:penicillin amidase
MIASSERPSRQRLVEWVVGRAAAVSGGRCPLRLRLIVVTALLAAGVLSGLAGGSLDRANAAGSATPLPGLQQPVRVIRDGLGIPHVYALNDHDAFFMNGLLEAQDRFFQMDVSRRQASGTLAELLGPGPGDQVLSTDVLLRTLGLRRAAERSLAAYPEWVVADLRAYADGVNAWLGGNPLPPEYSALELTKASVPAWSPLDSIAIGKLIAFGLSFDSGDLRNTQLLLSYQAVGSALGFDGTKLFFGDVMRSEPFDHTVSIPPGATSGPVLERPGASRGGPPIDPGELRAAEEFVRPAGSLDLGRPEQGGSNWWLVAGAKSATGFSLLAGDPHLSLSSPPVWYELGLTVAGNPHDAGMNVYGTGFPGVPGVVLGFNDRLMWSATVNPMDVTDFFQERVVVSGGVPVATLYKGVPEPLTIIPETFGVNQLDGTPDDAAVVAPGGRASGVVVPPATLVVPRLNNGPLITTPSGPAGAETAIGVAYTGFAPTRELQAVLGFDRARSPDDFKQALQFFDFGSQNWGVADVEGNIAYWTSAELPLREDLQAGTAAGLPPYFVRDGTGTLPNGWIPDASPPADQALPYQILPFAEMPQIVNPAEGFIASANNDPIGTTLDNDPLNQLRPGGGIYYLSPGYAIGDRVARITKLLQADLAGGGKVSLAGMQRIQSDVVLHDATVLVPYIEQAYRDAATPGAPAQLAAFAADPPVSEAVRRLADWDGSTPTGIPEGYDASDVNGARAAPSVGEIANSVAATIYSLWRGQILHNTIDATLQRVGLGSSALPSGDRALVALRHLLDTFPTAHGIGASGLNFFAVPGVASPEAARDILLLASVRDALTLAASSAFAPAFGGSTNQDDYRWGRLHRITFAHLLDGPFSIPPAAGFRDLAPGMLGLATDGGYDTVDAASHGPRAATLNGFMFNSGPSRRFIGDAQPNGIQATQVIPGGESGEPADPTFGNQLGLWLTNDAHAALQTRAAVAQNAASEQVFVPNP